MNTLYLKGNNKVEKNRLILCLVVSAFLLLSMLVVSQPVNAAEYEEDGFTYVLDGKKATIIDVTKEEKNVVVPEMISEYKVVEIGSRAFAHSKYESVTLPDSVKSIGYGAFGWMKNLKKVTLPAGLERLNSSCFSSCKALTEINFGTKLKTIGSEAFYNCIGLKSINLPESLVGIETRAFAKCINLKDINFNKKLKTIGNYAFLENSSLKSAVLPASLKIVRGNAFKKCIDLNKVVFKGEKTKLGEGVFEECSSLTSVKLPKNLRNIPVRTFMECKSLKSIKLPAKVSIIKKEAFFDCSKLRNVVINSKAYAIGDRAFAFSGIRKLKLNNNMQFIGNGAFRDTKLRSMKLGEKVTFIGSGIFRGCDKLKSIYVPASVKGINMGAFGGCTSLREINVAAGNENYSSLNGVLYNKDKKKLLQYPIDKRSATFVSPSGIETVRKGAFEGNSHLQNVSINAKVIGSNALYNMKNLKSVTLINTTKVGSYAFSGNKKLTNVKLADSITSIEYGAFRDTNIRTINIPSRLTKLGGNVFDGCKNLVAFTGSRTPKYAVQDGVLYTATMDKLIKYPSKKADKEFTVPDSVVMINSRAFEYNKNLRNLYLGSGTTKMEYQTIYKAKKLKTVMFYAKKVSRISSYAIEGCNNLAVIVGPNSWYLKRVAEYQNATFISA